MPSFDGYVRRGLSERQAYELDLNYFSFFPFRDEPSLWTVTFSANYIFQLNRTLAFSPGAQVSLNDNVLMEAYARNSSYKSEFKIAFPLLMKLDVRLSKLAHLELSYEYRGLSLNQNLRTHTVWVQPTFRW